ncbi:MAG TPA: DUF268 domain-containing protein [Bosea sp. (in: a-proteobacteria)]|jgi:hypothetical protein|uniref:DUF268 domain-containing protein n=1 Tax=Bosea sp. (in: a-proteobacteria) TaxID=1871050 RepID=UPI002E161248|nr:DUF268 domain-containing protein [Bosea sp. (in: a-proteobacteria)]
MTVPPTAPDPAPQGPLRTALARFKGAVLRYALQASGERQYIERTLAEKQYVESALAERDFVERCLANRNRISEIMHLPAYVDNVLTERYWLEDALREKDFVTRALDQRRGEARATGQFDADLAEFRAKDQTAGKRFHISDEDLLPQLADRTESTPFDRHYLYHPAWAARILETTRPKEHVDIGSILQFATITSAFIPTTFFDFRPAPLELTGLSSSAADLTALPFPDGSISSLSCMHVLEHIGLGRYGDPIDPDGDLKAIRELVRVLAPGGNLLVVTPVGRKRIQFNAHRIYDHEEFASYFAPLELVEFALIEEFGERGPITNPPAELARAQSYGCGCFWLRRKA